MTAAASGLRMTEVRRALHRANLLMGGERELVMFTALVAGGLIVTAQTWIATLVGLGLWFGLIGFLRAMAKADPRLSHVYTRHLQYQPYYPARSRPFRDR